MFFFFLEKVLYFSINFDKFLCCFQFRGGPPLPILNFNINASPHGKNYFPNLHLAAIVALITCALKFNHNFCLRLVIFINIILLLLAYIINIRKTTKD